MIAETISLGILSLPSALAAIGIVPYVHPPNGRRSQRLTVLSSGVILIIGLGIIATYTGYVIGQFKLAYPQVHNMCVHFPVYSSLYRLTTKSQELMGQTTPRSSPETFPTLHLLALKNQR